MAVRIILTEKQPNECFECGAKEVRTIRNALREGWLCVPCAQKYPCCDFCTDPVTGPTWDYPVRAFVSTGPVKLDNREGVWAACQICQDLIVDKSWHELALRSVRKDPPQVAKNMIERIAAVHQLVFQNVTGPAVFSS